MCCREVDSGVKVHKVLAPRHGLGLLEVRAVRDAVNLVLRVLGVLRHSHGRVHLHFSCLQLVVYLVHVLFKTSYFVASNDVLVERKDDLSKFVLCLLLEGSAKDNFGEGISI